MRWEILLFMFFLGLFWGWGLDVGYVAVRLLIFISSFKRGAQSTCLGANLLGIKRLMMM